MKLTRSAALTLIQTPLPVTARDLGLPVGLRTAPSLYFQTRVPNRWHVFSVLVRQGRLL